MVNGSKTARVDKKHPIAKFYNSPKSEPWNASMKACVTTKPLNNSCMAWSVCTKPITNRWNLASTGKL